MKIRSKYLLMIGFSILCSTHVLRGQSSNSTAGGFMSQFNSWISRLRGNNHSNNSHNNHNNNNNSDKEKEQQTKSTGQQMTPNVQYNLMPYPVMTGMSSMPGMSSLPGMSSMYGAMSPMAVSFGPRPMPSAAFAPGIPFGSLAAGSSIGPNIGPSMLGAGLGSSMASSLSSPMASAMSSGISSTLGSGFPQMSQLSSLRPSYSSASHMMPVHHDYHDSGNEYQVGSYGVPNTPFNSNGFSGLNSGLSSSNYGNLNNLNNAGPEQQINDSAYNGEQSEQNSGDEYSSAYQR